MFALKYFNMNILIHLLVLILIKEEMWMKIAI